MNYSNRIRQRLKCYATNATISGQKAEIILKASPLPVRRIIDLAKLKYSFTTEQLLELEQAIKQ